MCNCWKCIKFIILLFSIFFLCILGKGNKERIGYLNKSTKETLLKYLELRKIMSAKSLKDDDALFLSLEKKRICTRNIRKNIKKHIIKLDLMKINIQYIH